MPELPEVETTGRGLSAKLLGCRLIRLEQNRKDLRIPIPARLAARLEGATLREISRRAKYLLLRFDNGQTLLVHLGMSGRMVIDGAREKHDHLIFHFSNGKHVAFNDARRFGLVDLMPTAQEAQHRLLRPLGPEPLDKGFTPAVLHAALQGKKTAIKLALLDQTLVAGIGNIYDCEALFMAGIAPTRAAGSLSAQECAALVPAIKDVLKAAIKAGGSSLRDYVQTSGELGYFQHNFKVYDRAGLPCPSGKKGHTIARMAQGGRSTFYCPKCQR